MNPKSLDKNKTNKAEWEKEFEKFLITWEPLFYDQKVDGKAIRQLKDFISHQRQRLIERIEEEVIGEDEVNLSRPDAVSNEGDTRRFYENQLRAEQRQKLSAIRKEEK